MQDFTKNAYPDFETAVKKMFEVQKFMPGLAQESDIGDVQDCRITGDSTCAAFDNGGELCGRKCQCPDAVIVDEPFIGFKGSHEFAPQMPAKFGDAGYNLVIRDGITMAAGATARINTGARIQLPEGYFALLVGRSSAYSKYGLQVHTSVIDGGFTGCPAIIATNIGYGTLYLPQFAQIAQLVLMPLVTPPVFEVAELPETDRGETGFGSSDA